MRFYLGPWRWDSDLAAWAPPVGALASMDLRSLPDCGAAEKLGDHPHGLFASAVSLGSDYTLLLNGAATDQIATRAVDAWESVLGYRPSGQTIGQLLWDHLTTGADPDGQTAALPLAPDHMGNLVLTFGGVQARSDRFTRLHPHWPKVRALLQSDFGRLFSDYDALATATRRDALRLVPLKVLGGLCQKYGLSRLVRSEWEDLVPLALRAEIDAPKAPETTITDDFNRADENLEAGSWDMITGSLVVASNQVGPDATTGNTDARHTSDLSSSDHAAQVDFVTATNALTFVSPCCRFASAARTYYAGIVPKNSGGSIGIWKVVAGAFTRLTTPTSTNGDGTTVKLSANGSSLELFRNGVSISTVTDTAIAGNVRAGMLFRAIDTAERGDNFSASDLGGAVARLSRLSMLGVG